MPSDASTGAAHAAAAVLAKTNGRRNPATREIRLDVVIVSYRCAALVSDCLTALAEHAPRASMHVHVVDNASRDGTVELVRRAFPSVDVREAASNLGFARANNSVIAETSGDYVLVLNPDTRVSRGALDRLLALMEERPEVGIVGCRLVRADGSFDHAARRSFPTIVGALGHFSGAGRRMTQAGRLSQYRALDVEGGPVDAVNGAFMLIRRAALDEVGLFDEGYWMFMEDLDLCYRFTQAGWGVWYEPTVSVLHLKGATLNGRRRPRLAYAFHYGMFRFYRKFYASSRNPLVNGVVYLGIALKLAVAFARGAVPRATPLRRRGRRTAEAAKLRADAS